MTNDQFTLLVSVDTKVTALLNHKNDHEARIRKLERTRNWLAGVGATVSAILGWIFYPK